MTMNSNQIILITGGGRGLGRAIALGAAQTGARVAVTARSTSELTETVDLIRRAGGRAVALPADVTDHHAVVGMVAAAESQLGPIPIISQRRAGRDHTARIRLFLASVSLLSAWRIVRGDQADAGAAFGSACIKPNALPSVSRQYAR